MLNRLKNKLISIIEDIKYTSALNTVVSQANHEAFSKLKNMFYGKNVALCGAGPSLKNYKSIPNCIHVALNRAILNKHIIYDWFIADDWDGIDFLKEEILNFNGTVFLGSHLRSKPIEFGCYSREIPRTFITKCNAKQFFTDSYIVNSGFNSRFVCDIDKMAVGNMPNIALTAMQILLFANPATIYIVGCDASSGHFIQPEQLTEERIKIHEKDLNMAVKGDKIRKKWLECKYFAETFYPETKIVSINPVGLKGIFEDKFQ